ncbi:membrane-bound metal-dependent hydrolase [Neobacillus bataviensis LMG 21833]|uniref:Membrane-bound metal-dependent hydrolase n=1 Tax=Neobacillus bataviensis LMG 21833 TaxID=1117379 RepID=K6DCY1_9BACI|nr:metal-dependent hydrolase [Neobacillus bataviensis]EKN65928.1 membrane-bound metal-dependent hydrolase [Neobacillus bataviensis LMG 21833]
MDTFSHIVIGLGIGALAQIDPFVSENQTLSQAVLLSTAIGSNAPDFDFIYRLRGKGSYFRNHRGLSHSLPALPLWAILVSGLLYPFFPGIDFLHLFLWTLLAVILHVLFDLFNVHGTQILLPFSRKWFAFDAVPLIDPYMLVLHFLGFGLLLFYQPGITFLVIYLFTFLYLGIRAFFTSAAKRHLNHHFMNAVRIKLIPQITLLKWDVIIETDEDFLFGVYSEKSLAIEHTLSKKNDFPVLVSESRMDQSISDFLACTTFAYPFVDVRKNGYFIYWKDLRFRTKKFFPYLAIQFISSDFKHKNSYIGKVHSLKHYKKVLRLLSNSTSMK